MLVSNSITILGPTVVSMLLPIHICCGLVLGNYILVKLIAGVVGTI